MASCFGISYAYDHPQGLVDVRGFIGFPRVRGHGANPGSFPERQLTILELEAGAQGARAACRGTARCERVSLQCLPAVDGGGRWGHYGGTRRGQAANTRWRSVDLAVLFPAAHEKARMVRLTQAGHRRESLPARTLARRGKGESASWSEKNRTGCEKK